MIKKAGGQGIWTDWVDTKTGRHSLTENIQPKLVARWCRQGKHEYFITDPGKREMKCRICSHESKFVVGRDKIKGDRIILS